MGPKMDLFWTPLKVNNAFRGSNLLLFHTTRAREGI